MIGARPKPAGGLFWAGFVLTILIIAGAVSYLASPDPDGLDAATRHGCAVIDRDGSEELTGQCIARSAADHPLAGSPLADYSLGGASGTVGPAGVVGVLVTVAVAGGLFRVIARTRPQRGVRAPGD